MPSRLLFPSIPYATVPCHLDYVHVQGNLCHYYECQLLMLPCYPNCVCTSICSSLRPMPHCCNCVHVQGDLCHHNECQLLMLPCYPNCACICSSLRPMPIVEMFRVTSATTMNAHSSRSHAILTVYMRVAYTDPIGKTSAIVSIT